MDSDEEMDQEVCIDPDRSTYMSMLNPWLEEPVEANTFRDILRVIKKVEKGKRKKKLEKLKCALEFLQYYVHNTAEGADTKCWDLKSLFIDIVICVHEILFTLLEEGQNVMTICATFSNTIVAFLQRLQTSKGSEELLNATEKLYTFYFDFIKQNPTSWFYALASAGPMEMIVSAYDEASNREKFSALMKSNVIHLTESVSVCGDYLCQHSLLVVLIVWLQSASRECRNELMKSCFLMMNEGIKNILISDFLKYDADYKSRFFLKFLNDHQARTGLTQRIVKSLVCIYAFVGDNQIFPAEHERIPEFWISFSKASGRLHCFCSFATQDWCTLNIHKDDIESVCFYWSRNDNMETELSNTQMSSVVSRVLPTTQKCSISETNLVAVIHLQLKEDFRTLCDIAGIGAGQKSVFMAFNDPKTAEEALESLEMNRHTFDRDRCKLPNEFKKLLKDKNITFTQVFDRECKELANVGSQPISDSEEKVPVRQQYRKTPIREYLSDDSVPLIKRFRKTPRYCSNYETIDIDSSWKKPPGTPAPALQLVMDTSSDEFSGDNAISAQDNGRTMDESISSEELFPPTPVEEESQHKIVNEKSPISCPNSPATEQSSDELFPPSPAATNPVEEKISFRSMFGTKIVGTPGPRHTNRDEDNFSMCPSFPMTPGSVRYRDTINNDDPLDASNSTQSSTPGKLPEASRRSNSSESGSLFQRQAVLDLSLSSKDLLECEPPKSIACYIPNPEVRLPVLFNNSIDDIPIYSDEEPLAPRRENWNWNKPRTPGRAKEQSLKVHTRAPKPPAKISDDIYKNLDNSANRSIARKSSTSAELSYVTKYVRQRPLTTGVPKNNPLYYVTQNKLPMIRKVRVPKVTGRIPCYRQSNQASPPNSDPYNFILQLEADAAIQPVRTKKCTRLGKTAVSKPGRGRPTKSPQPQTSKASSAQKRPKKAPARSPAAAKAKSRLTRKKSTIGELRMTSANANIGCSSAQEMEMEGVGGTTQNATRKSDQKRGPGAEAEGARKVKTGSRRQEMEMEGLGGTTQNATRKSDQKRGPGAEAEGARKVKTGRRRQEMEMEGLGGTTQNATRKSDQKRGPGAEAEGARKVKTGSRRQEMEMEGLGGTTQNATRKSDQKRGPGAEAEGARKVKTGRRTMRDDLSSVWQGLESLVSSEELRESDEALDFPEFARAGRSSTPFTRQATETVFRDDLSSVWHGLSSPEGPEKTEVGQEDEVLREVAPVERVEMVEQWRSHYLSQTPLLVADNDSFDWDNI